MKKFFVLSMVLAALYAGNTPEYGYRFGDKPKAEQKSKKTIEWYLAQILKTQKEQLEVQKKILAILEQQYNPKPKWIIVNGKKCIANSSAECFEFPITPAAKRIPVLANMLRKRDKESVRKYLQWQAKYFKELFKIGNGFRFVMAQYGPKAYPLAYNSIGTETPQGYSVVLKSKMEKYLLNKYAKENKFKLYIIYGLNKDADLITFAKVAEFLREIPDLKVDVVFNNDEEIKTFKAMQKVLLPLKLTKNRIKVYKDPQIVKRLKLYTTPAYFIYMNGKLEPIGVGTISSSDLISRITDYLLYKGVIKESEFAGYEMWQKVGDKAPEYYKHYFDLDLRKLNNGKKEE